MLHIVPGPVSAAARHSRRSGQAGAEDDSEGEGSRLEAAAAASTLCLGLCAGATLTRGDDVEQLYPPMAEMVRGAVVVTATSRWVSGTVESGTCEVELGRPMPVGQGLGISAWVALSARAPS